MQAETSALAAFANKFALPAYAIVASVFAWLNIPQDAFLCYLYLVVIDSAMGSYNAGKRDKDSFSSWRLKNGFAAKILTLTCVLTAAALLFNKILGVTPENASISFSFVLGLFSMAEFVSIMRNAIEIRTGEKIAEFDGVTFIMKWLYAATRSMLESATKKK